ncbi:MAG: potassium transporter TrkG [archaeon]
MKTVLNYLGKILIVASFFRIFPLLLAAYYREPLSGFIISIIVSLVLGSSLVFASSVLRLVSKSSSMTMSLSEGLILSALSFLFLSLTGSISYLFYFSGPVHTVFFDSVFESTSGFTTTGLSVVTDLDNMPLSLKFWRAETQWLGGIGIIIVFLFILMQVRLGAKEKEVQDKTGACLSLYQGAGYSVQLEPNMRKSSLSIIRIYLLYTLIGVLLLHMAGLSVFEAVSVSFTSVSTGGFSMSSSFYTDPVILAILSGLMIAGSISFVAHNKLLRGQFTQILVNPEIRMLVFAIVVGALICFLTIKDIKVAVFTVISAITTTGYSIVPMKLPSIMLFVITLCMLAGGSMVSTAGGLKLFRIFVVFRSIPWMIRKLSSPASAVVRFKAGEKAMSESSVLTMHVFISLYLIILIAGTLVFMIFGYSFFDSAFQLISALSTVGLQSVSIAGMNVVLKGILILAMLLGRLEIFPLVVAISHLMRHHNTN